MSLFDGTLTLSTNLDYFEHQGALYVYHNLFGYILQMSRDVVDFLEWFRGQDRSEPEALLRFVEMPPDQLANFIQVFELQACLVPSGAHEEGRVWKMVPVLARWSVCHVPAQGAVSVYLTREGGEVEVEALSAWESELWRRIDGEATWEEILAAAGHEGAPASEEERRALVVGLQRRFAHHGAQVLKLSARPMSFYRAGQSRRAVPPYLSSSMPYRRVTQEILGGESAAEVARGAQEAEVTFEHLFREPHEALGGRTYGGALLDYARGQQLGVSGARWLVVGARRGNMARGMWERLAEVEPGLAAKARLVIHAVDEAAAAQVRADLEGSGVPSWVVVTGAAGALGSNPEVQGPFDAVFCDEYLARLDTVLMHRIPNLTAEEEADDPAFAAELAAMQEALGEAMQANPKGPSGGKGKGSKDFFMGEGDSVSVLLRYHLSFDDVDGEFFFNLGAVRLLEQVAGLLVPGGVGVFVEYGDLFKLPEPSESVGGGVQFSVHYDPLMKVARALKLEPSFDWVVGLLDFDRSARMLASTRKHAKALGALLGSRGVELRDVAWSRAMLERACAGKVSLDEIRPLEFSSLNDRVMGILPSSLKMLVVQKPLPMMKGGEA